MTAHLITLNYLYSFDPAVTVVTTEEFEDVVGQHFKHPREGLGFDGSPVAHMWRTMIWPNSWLWRVLSAFPTRLGSRAKHHFSSAIAGQYVTRMHPIVAATGKDVDIYDLFTKPSSELRS